MSDMLLELLMCTCNCAALLANGHAAPLVQRLDAVLDTFAEEADKCFGKQCLALNTLLQVTASAASRHAD